MMQSASYCLSHLRAVDYERYLATLYAPPSKRPHLAALFAFNAEIARIRETVKDPLLGEIRLRWWRDALDNSEELQTAALGPVLQALRATIIEFDLPKEAFLRYCDARLFDLYNDPMPDMVAFEAYCRETACMLLQLSCQILNKDAAKIADDACVYGGFAQAMGGLLRMLPITQARAQIYLPMDIIKAAGAEAEDVLEGRLNKGQKRLIIEAATALAWDYYQALCVHYKAVPKVLLSAFLPLALIPHSLRQSVRLGAENFTKVPTLSSLRRYSAMAKMALTGHLPSL